MAKIRVHELAKKLNMTNKALLTKLKAMNIEVKSHMSSLEDETVTQIKLNIFGSKQKDQESRVGTAVIRRRKKSGDETSAAHPDNRESEDPKKIYQPLSESDSDKQNSATSGKATTEHTLEERTPSDSERLHSAHWPSTKNMDTVISTDQSSDLSSLHAGVSLAETDNAVTENANKTPIQEEESVHKHESVVERKLVDAQIQPVENGNDSAETMLSASNKSADNSSDTPATSKESGRSGAADKNKTTESFNIKEADMPTDSERTNKLKEQTNNPDNTDNTRSTTEDNVVAQQQQDDDDDDQNSTEEELSDLTQGSDASTGNDRKKKRKKKQKKSEPARIIKMAEPPPPPPPPPAPLAPPPPKKREFVEKPTGVKTSSSDKDRPAPGRERPSYEKGRQASDKERVPFNKERTGSETPATGREKPSFAKGTTAAAASERDRSQSNRERTPFDKEKSAPYSPVRSGAKTETPFARVRNKKIMDVDLPVIPAEPSEKDDLKAKRSKSKLKKKKWGEDEDQGEDLKSGQKKRKSVVEGKDLYEQGFSGRKGRKKDAKSKQRPKVQKTQITVPKAIKRRIRIDETIDLSELAKRMSIKANEMIQKLMGMGIMVTLNQTIDFDTAALVAAEFDYEVEKAAVAEDMLLHAHEADDPAKLISRSPVVTIMGHVDHGKTSLLDVIRKSKIVTGEAGGITQHIGAYSVQTPNGGIVTFLDTPGHAAFTSMRSRGAQITDLVVLVVAADDGVMPQTVEAINHSKAAGVPVVVAVNKMDKPDADPDRVMRELSDHGLLAEEWGGDVIFAKVSAKAGTGIDELLEMILLQAEVLELKADPDRLATGHVVEARLDAGRGPVATVLVQQGTLKNGQPVVCGLHSGKIRFMIDDMGKTIDTAGPSTPVEIVGLSGVPEAGDEFIALASEKDAKQISESRMQKERAKELAKKSRANLEKLFANMGSDQAKQLKLIIKADVHGSLEALNESLIKLSQEEVDIKIVHSGTGAINESDVSLAAVSDAIIIGFNVRPTPKVREMAKEENVDMRFYDIIYNVINDIKTALTGLMPSTFHEIIIGRAEVRDMFVIPGKGTIAGCFVQEGKVARGEKMRLLRDGVIKCDSTLSSLRRFKDDAKEVTQGYECGIGIDRFNDLKVGDIIECYQIEERKASLESIK